MMWREDWRRVCCGGGSMRIIERAKGVEGLLGCGGGGGSYNMEGGWGYESVGKVT